MSDEEDPEIPYVIRLQVRRSVLDRVRKAARESGIPIYVEVARRLSHDLPPLNPPIDLGGRSRKNQTYNVTQKTVVIEDEAQRIFDEQPELATAIARLVGSVPASVGGMTKRQADLLAFMRKYATEHNGSTPTYEEMMKGLGFASKSSINRLVVGLEERGFIARAPGQAQSIKLV
jgi:hypothetical protein